jgi:hypothetical protein
MPRPLLPTPMMNRRVLLGSLGGMMVGGAAMARRPSDVACSANAADYSVKDKLYWVGESFVWAGTLPCEGSVRTALIRQRPGQDAEVIRTLAHYEMCPDGLALGVRMITPEGIVHIYDADGEFVQRLINPDSSATDLCLVYAGYFKTELTNRGYTDIKTLAAGIPRMTDQGAAGPVPFLVIRRQPDKSTSELLLFRGDAEPRRMTVDWPLASFSPSIFPDYQSGGWIAWSRDQHDLVDLGYPGIPVGRISPDFELDLRWIPVEDWMSSLFFFPVGARLGVTSSRTGKKGRTYDGIYLQVDSGWERRFASDVQSGSLAYSPDGRFIGWEETVSWDLSFQGIRHIPRIEDLAGS